MRAGRQRKALAQSIAATSGTSGNSGSSGKRSVKDVKSTPSTRVTPEAKFPCPAEDVVDPRAINIEAEPTEAGSTGEAEPTGLVCVYVYLCAWLYIYIYYL